MDQQYKNYYHLISRAVFLITSVIILLWFAFQIIEILLLFFLVVVLTLVLNAPTTWLQSKGLSRTLASLIVFFSVLIFIAAIAWLVIPKISEQLTALVNNLPDYINSLSNRLSSWFGNYPGIRDKLSPDNFMGKLPSATTIVTGIGRYSLSVLGTVFLIVVFFSILIYMLINPEPLLETYLYLFPHAKRQKAAEALTNASTMVIGWMWSNFLAGAIEAVAVGIFLALMGVPGFWVWAGLTIFAELIPKIGFYIMSVPPVLIALSIHPATALWVAIFYLAMNEVMGDFVIPKIRASTMNIHAVSTLFLLLAMGSAFGLIGAFIATPMTAFIKAYYEAFYLKESPKAETEEQINMILHRKPKQLPKGTD